ncbi:MAG: YbaN family protein [Firmicutes bacterium]|nr:YbaN family protein [Bacillota bacterium]
MRILFVIIGTISLVVGIIGVVLPILPTTPFLLLTAYCYARGSKRFHDWFIKTKIYKKYLESYAETRSMTIKHKWTLMIVVDTMLLITFFTIDSLALRILIVALIILKHLYFHTQVKIIKIQEMPNSVE